MRKWVNFNVRRHRRGGFTLIELLIVISIIALLAAILFPAFARARANARRAACASNLKQIGMGMLQYSQDNDELLPLLVNSAGIVGQINNPMSEKPWSSIPPLVTDWYPNPLHGIYPYVRTTEIYHCPEAIPVTGTQKPTALNDISYNYNEGLATFPAGTINAAGTASIYFRSRPLSQFTRSSEIISFWDWPTRSAQMFLKPCLQGAGNTGPYFIRYTPFFYGANSPGPIHFEGFNCLFIDGHVKWRLGDGLRASDFGLIYTSNTALDPDWNSGLTTGVYGFSP